MEEVQRKIDHLNDLFFEAAETERKLPAAIKRQKMASWPEYVRTWDSYGWHDAEPNIGKASAKQVSRFEYALDLAINKCNAEDRKIIWAVAHSAAFRYRGPTWVKLSKIYHCDRRTIKQRYMDALVRLYYRL